MIEVELELQDPETTCEICYAEFLDAEDLIVHVNQMHSSRLQNSFKTCQFCTQRFGDLESYAYHLRDVHLSSLLSCKYCNKAFDEVDQHRKHETKHYVYVNKSKYSCSTCKMLFTNTAELEQHEQEKHKDSNGVVLSEVLPLLSSIINIKASSFLQSLSEQVVYVCVMCELSTPNVIQYINHLKKLGCRSLVCNTCSSVFKNRAGITRHFVSHPECFHGGENYKKQCTECFKMFSVKTWTDHTKKCKAIKCKDCNIVFVSMYDLSKHQTDAHPLTVLLKSCKYCNKDFAGSAALEKHIERTHSSQIHLYKYVCVYCQSIFKHPKNLFQHFFSTHKELEPYTCTICDKKFRIRKRFTIHIKLDHKSIGYIEFDDKYHVFFSDKKSEQPFVPPSLTETEIQTADNAEGNETIDLTAKENDSTEKNEDNETVDSTKENGSAEKNVDNSLVNKNAKKVQFNVKEKGEGEINLVNVNSDFMSATETEGENEKTQRKKKTRTNRKRAHIEALVSDSSDDDEPLLHLLQKEKRLQKLRLRNATWNRKKKEFKDNKKRFICPICKKNCFTFQNFNNHISLHYRNVTKCIKCSQDFRSKEELNEHCALEHSSSQLTETLRNLIEKRKQRSNNTVELSNTEKFLRTIKKVAIPKDNMSATLTPVNNSGLSVQKFIESFTPESEAPKKEVVVETNISIKPVSGVYKEPLIKMTKCNLEHIDLTSSSLAMPVRFKETGDDIQATVKVVITKVDVSPEENESYCEDNNMEIDNFHDTTDHIPEVAHEVMLGGTEDTTKTLFIPHKVVLPKLPKNYKDIHIAHLQPEAPFYKIVKVEEVLNPPKPPEVIPEPKKDIKLPDGTHLVSVNPLAHLLGETQVEKILEINKNRYYQQKPKDFETAIAKAMLKLNKTQVNQKKQKKVSTRQ